MAIEAAMFGGMKSLILCAFFISIKADYQLS